MIPSSAFIKIGQNLIAQPVVKTAVIHIPKREPIPIPQIVETEEVSAYDILKEWASLIVDFFGEYI